LYFAYKYAQVIILHENSNLLKNLLGVIIQIRGTEYSLGLWFLPLLFITELIVALILRIHASFQLPAVLFTTTIGFVYVKVFGRALPWGIDAAFVMTLFVYAGFMVRQIVAESIPLDRCGIVYKAKCYFQQRILNSNLAVVGVIILMLSLNIICNLINIKPLSTGVDMWALRYGNPFLYVFAASFGIAFVVFVCSIGLKNIKINSILFIGQNTLHFYCLHIMVLSIVKKINEWIVIEKYCGLVITDLLLASITVVICYIIVKVVKNIAHQYHLVNNI
ncbi:MAG: hypothetical protein Q4B70_19640, partial [Lachnospiraceae bacterium]|nr:hypothetical protein [Lachnospiraceae bacterium]